MASNQQHKFSEIYLFNMGRGDFSSRYSYIPTESKRSKPGEEVPDEIDLPDVDLDAIVEKHEVSEECDLEMADTDHGNGDGSLTKGELKAMCDKVCVPDSPDSKLLMEASVVAVCHCCPVEQQKVFFASYVPIRIANMSGSGGLQLVMLNLNHAENLCCMIINSRPLLSSWEGISHAG